MKKGLLLSLVASTMIFAGGDVAPVAVDTWSGFYAGASVGGIQGDGDMDITVAGVTWELNGFEPESLTGGFYAGYNWLSTDNVLFGLEVQANWMSADDQLNNINANANYDYKLEQKWEAALLARVGQVIDDTYMPYIVGGATWTELTGAWVYLPAPGTLPVETESSDTVMGWTIGAGLEIKISDDVHAKVEYRYSDYSDAELSHIDVAGVTTETISYSTSAIQAGVSIRF